jgi:hypothetical protein
LCAEFIDNYIIIVYNNFKKIDRKGKSVERRGRKATDLKLKSYDSRVAGVSYSNLWEGMPKGFFCFDGLSIYFYC